MKLITIYVLIFFSFVGSISGSSSSSCDKLKGCWDCLSSSSECLWMQCAKVYAHDPGYFWFTHFYTQDIAGGCIDPLHFNASLLDCTLSYNSPDFSVEHFNFTQPAQCQHRPYDGSYSSYFSFSLLLLLLLVVLFSLLYYFTYRHFVAFVQSYWSFGLSAHPGIETAPSPIPSQPSLIEPSTSIPAATCFCCSRSIPPSANFCNRCSWEYLRFELSLLPFVIMILIQLYHLISYLCLSDSTIAHFAPMQYLILITYFVVVPTIVLSILLVQYLPSCSTECTAGTADLIIDHDQRSIYLEENAHLLLRPDEEYYLLQRSQQSPPKTFSLACIEPGYLPMLFVVALLFPFIASPDPLIPLDWAIYQDFILQFVVVIIFLIISLVLILGLAIPFFALHSGGHHCKFLVITSQRTILVYHILPSNSYRLRSIEHPQLTSIIPICPGPNSPSIWMRIRAVIFHRPFFLQEHAEPTYCTIPIEQLSNRQLLEFRLIRKDPANAFADNLVRVTSVTSDFPDLSQSISLIAMLSGLSRLEWNGTPAVKGRVIQTIEYLSSLSWIVLFVIFFDLWLTFNVLPVSYKTLVFFMIFFFILGMAGLTLLPTISLVFLFSLWFIMMGLGIGGSSIFYLIKTPFILIGIPLLLSFNFSHYFLQIKQYCLPFSQKDPELSESTDPKLSGSESSSQETSDSFSHDFLADERDEI